MCGSQMLVGCFVCHASREDYLSQSVEYCHPKHPRKIALGIDSIGWLQLYNSANQSLIIF